MLAIEAFHQHIHVDVRGGCVDGDLRVLCGFSPAPAVDDGGDFVLAIGIVLGCWDRPLAIDHFGFTDQNPVYKGLDCFAVALPIGGA